MSAHTPQVTLFPPAARTGPPTAEEFDADGHHGCHVVIDVTAVTATPSVVPTVDFYDSLSGKWCNLLTGSAITAVGTTVLKIYPGLAPVSEAAVSDCIHGRLRLAFAHADGDSITYCAAAHLIG